MDEKHVNEIDGNVKYNRYEKLFRTERGFSNYELPSELEHATSGT